MPHTSPMNWCFMSIFFFVVLIFFISLSNESFKMKFSLSNISSLLSLNIKWMW